MEFVRCGLCQRQMEPYFDSWHDVSQHYGDGELCREAGWFCGRCGHTYKRPLGIWLLKPFHVLKRILGLVRNRPR